MKTKHFLALSILPILFLSQLLQAQNYVPLPDSNVVWKIYWMPYPPDEPWTALHYDYISSGDTVINDNNYTKLFKIEYDLYCSKIADTFYIGAYRNDTPNKIVYFYQDSVEKILYNFSLTIGDTIPTSYYIETDDEEMIVAEIDTIQLENGEYRKQFTYCFPFSDGTCIEGTDMYDVVEGIGFLWGLLEPMSLAAELINSRLICNHFNDSLLYITEWYEECRVFEDTCLTTGLNESECKTNFIEIVPNPIVSTATIRFINPIQTTPSYTLTLYNLLGHEIKNIHAVSNGTKIVNKSELNAGMYIYVLWQKNNIVQTGKIIVNP